MRRPPPALLAAGTVAGIVIAVAGAMDALQCASSAPVITALAASFGAGAAAASWAASRGGRTAPPDR